MSVVDVAGLGVQLPYIHGFAVTAVAEYLRSDTALASGHSTQHCAGTPAAARVYLS
jgi:hypothetical protein